MSELDELAKVIESGYSDDPTDCPFDHAPTIADAILAAGYRKPRTITTVEELDALPHLTVIKDGFGRVFERWILSGWQVAGRTLHKHPPLLPAKVLHEPVPKP